MIKVLLVDDIKDNLYLLESLLKGNGYSTTSASNGAEALDLAVKDPPNIIISDILMPIMDGYSLCREWKKDELLRNIPFVFYTATYTHPKDEDFAMSLGADMFILKPQEPDVFIAKIKKILSDFNIQNRKAHEPTTLPEEMVLKEYNETLIRKLEDRMLQSEESEKQIRIYATQLEMEIEQRKQLTRNLEESEIRFRTLAETAPVGIFSTDVLGATTYVNPKWCEIAQQTYNDAQGYGWLNAIHPDDRDSLAEIWQQAIQTKAPSVVECRFKHQDGYVVWVIGKANPQKDEHGTTVG
ncbi:MAG: response regulator [Bacteroidales bacterium]|nr:MAG: response regulator [Bacteroidales bacterium]